MARKMKKALSLLLALTMALSLMSVTALAGEKTDAANEALKTAQGELARAKEALIAAQGVQSGAQTAYDAAKASYDAAVAAIDTTALTGAETAWKTAQGETAKAQADLDAAAAELTKAEEAQAALGEEATEEEKTAAAQRVEEAGADKALAETTLSEKQGAEGEMKTAYDTAKSAYEAEVAKVDATDVGIAYNDAKKALNQANADLSAAQETVTTKEAAVKKAEEDVAGAMDADAADAVAAQINALTDTSSPEEIRAARAAYEALTAVQKALISAETAGKLQTADASLYTIHTGMTQEEVDAAVSGASTITVQPGNYGAEKSHIKINLTAGNQTVVLSGDYNRLMLVVLSEGNVLQAENARITGEVSTVSNQSPALYIPYGSLTLEGSLTIEDHDYGVILGYTDAGTEVVSALTVAEGAALQILGCQSASSSSYDNGIVCAGTPYFSNVDSQGDGTRGSAIATKGVGVVRISVESNALVRCENNYGAGIFPLTVESLDIDVKAGARVLLNSNGQGICLNTDDGKGRYCEKFTLTLNGAWLETCNNRSNGITGQSKPYLLDVKNGSTFKSDGNGAIGLNNFFVKVADSDISVSNNRSHGATNIALTMTDSNGTFSNNAYVGLNVTKYNSGETATVISGSTISAENNGGPGIRFFVSGGQTQVSDSKIYADGNGNGTSVYGYTVKPGDSGYWAGIVGKGDVVLTDSFVSSVSAGGYSLYNDSTAPGNLYVSGTDVVALNGGQSDSDIFDDWNSAKKNTGRTVVTGGSLQADSQKMSGDALADGLNDWIPDASADLSKGEKQFGAPVNTYGTALTRFDLNSELGHGTALTDNGDGTYTFTTYDPNAVDGDDANTYPAYTYTFRYNTAGEDLVEGESGNAYVWAPVSVIHYDATEGNLVLGSSTAVEGDVALTNTRGDGSAVGNAALGKANIDATDYTIYGGSLWLSEGVQPTASRGGYNFSGWFVRVENGTVVTDWLEQCTTNGAVDWTRFYNGLNTQVTGDTALAALFGSADMAEVTVYAKWTTEPVVIPPDTPTPPSTDPEDPGTDIPEEDPPQGEQPEDSTDIPEEDVPQGEAPVEEIPDEDVPQGEAPKTGDVSLLYAALAGVSGLGLVGTCLLGRKKRDEE